MSTREVEKEPAPGAQADAVVVGAGIVGASTAYALSKAGLHVIIIEAHRPASGTSGASFAYINAVRKQPEHYFHLSTEAVAAYARLEHELGSGLGLHLSGSLEWAVTGAARDELLARAARVRAWGAPSKTLCVADAALLEPDLRIPESVPEVLYRETDGWVDAPVVVEALLTAAARHGAQLWSGSAVTGIDYAQGHVRGVRAPFPIATTRVIDAAGVNAPLIARMVGVDVPVYPQPGVLALTSVKPTGLRRVVYAPDIHLRPTGDGRIILGSHDIDSMMVEARVGAETWGDMLRQRGMAIVPALADATVERVLIGVRPMPQDDHPIIGPVGPHGFYVAVMHSGVTLGPLVGELIAREMVLGETVAALEPFRPSRFAPSGV